MHARVSYYDLGGASGDDVKRGFEKAVASVKDMQGSHGGMALVNQQDGKALTITLWESEDALRSTEQQADQVRADAASSAGVTITGVERYEVVLEF